MRLGNRNGRRPFLTPENAGMTDKVDARLEHLVAAANVRAQAAIDVDGVRFVLWQRSASSESGVAGRTCSCHGGKTRLPSVHLSSTAGREDSSSPASAAHFDALNGGDFADYELVGRTAKTRPGNPGSERYYEAIGLGDEEDLIEAVGADSDSSDKYSVEDGEHDALQDFDTLEEFVGGSEALATPGVIGDGFTTATSVSCPVCCGATYVEAWQPYGGRRMVFSFLETDDWTCPDGQLDTDAAPFTMKLSPGQTLAFTLKTPYLFTSVVKFSVWNGKAPIDIVTAGVQVQAPGTADYVLATDDVLAAYSGTGLPMRFRLTAKTSLLLTHAHLTVMLRELPKAQFPPLNMPLDQDMAEFMGNIAIECNADIYAAPGDVISDFKYKKCWRITNAVPKFTAGGRSLLVNLDLSAVSTYEPHFNLHPFFVPVMQGNYRFSGSNESRQGSGNFRP